MSGREDRSIRSLCVVGAGVTGLCAALAFARALPRLQVSLIATPADPAAVADRVLASLPSVHRFHAAIGLDELGLVQDGVALHHLGTRFDNWSASGDSWFHVFDDYGLPAAGVPFHQIWAQLRKSNQAEAFDHYSAAASLARSGKFVHPQDDPRSLLSNFIYGLRLQPERYRARLTAEAKKVGIECVAGVLGGIEQHEEGRVIAVRLSDGRSIAADLFVDCAGTSAPLRSALDDDFEDWSDWLPCDRLTFGATLPPLAPLPCDNITAVAHGWRWASTLPAEHSTGLAWSSSFCDEQQALDHLCGEASVAAGETVAIRPGRRLEPWKGNVLALGDAAVTIDPLQSANFALVHSAILRALELLPGRDCHPLELREYNRRTAQETTRVRDFLALHYLRSGRHDGDFWQAAANSTPPDSLAHSLDQYETRGRLPFYEEESFEPQSWLGVLGGLEVIPRRIDPASDRIDLGQAAASMTQFAQRLVDLPARLPDYQAYLRRMAAQPSR